MFHLWSFSRIKGCRQPSLVIAHVKRENPRLNHRTVELNHRTVEVKMLSAINNKHANCDREKARAKKLYLKNTPRQKGAFYNPNNKSDPNVFTTSNRNVACGAEEINQTIVWFGSMLFLMFRTAEVLKHISGPFGSNASHNAMQDTWVLYSSFKSTLLKFRIPPPPPVPNVVLHFPFPKYFSRTNLTRRHQLPCANSAMNSIHKCHLTCRLNQIYCYFALLKQHKAAGVCWIFWHVTFAWFHCQDASWLSPFALQHLTLSSGYGGTLERKSLTVR